MSEKSNVSLCISGTLTASTATGKSLAKEQTEQDKNEPSGSKSQTYNTAIVQAAVETDLVKKCQERSKQSRKSKSKVDSTQTRMSTRSKAVKESLPTTVATTLIKTATTTEAEITSTISAATTSTSKTTKTAAAATKLKTVRSTKVKKGVGSKRNKFIAGLSISYNSILNAEINDLMLVNHLDNIDSKSTLQLMHEFLVADIHTLPSADAVVIDQYIVPEISGQNVNVCTDVTTEQDDTVVCVGEVQDGSKCEQVSPMKMLQVDKSSLSFSPNFSARKLSASGELQKYMLTLQPFCSSLQKEDFDFILCLFRTMECISFSSVLIARKINII